MNKVPERPAWLKGHIDGALVAVCGDRFRFVAGWLVLGTIVLGLMAFLYSGLILFES